MWLLFKGCVFLSERHVGFSAACCLPHKFSCRSDLVIEVPFGCVGDLILSALRWNQ